MSINKCFPAVLLAYVAGTNCELTPEQCNELTKYVSGMELRIAELEAAQRWIPVEERLPEEFDDVHVTNGNYVYRAYREDSIWWEELGFETSILHHITHWRPFPQPPQKDGEG